MTLFDVEWPPQGGPPNRMSTLPLVAFSTSVNGRGSSRKLADFLLVE